MSIAAFGTMRGQSMFYKTNDVVKKTFMVLGLAGLLSSTAMAQNTLALIEDDAPAETTDSGLNNNDSNLAEPVNNSPLAANNAPVVAKLGEAENISEPSVVAPLGNIDSNPLRANSQENTGGDPVVEAYNNFVEEDSQQTEENTPNTDDEAAFGDKIMSQVKEDLFSQMADIEKQTSLLSLELKREKIKNEIAAMHAQRKKAIDEEKEKQLERERKQAEWEKEQERKLLEDQQALKKLEIKFEKLRQERVLKAYKDTMLKSNQEWIDYNARLYNQLIKVENRQNEVITQYKEYFKNLSEKIKNISAVAQQAKDKHNQEIAELQTKLAILQSKLEAEKAKAVEYNNNTNEPSGTPNPFALAEEETGPVKKIAEEYAIMEISGKGENLIAKLINKNGGTFMVKPGTILNTGHVIEEITQTYIVAAKGGKKDYLYFSAGGILDKEPAETINAAPTVTSVKVIEEPTSKSKRGGGIPNLRAGMFVE